MDSIYKILRDNLQTINAGMYAPLALRERYLPNRIIDVLGDTYLASLQAIGTCLKSIYSALEEASAVWYDAPIRESARVSALEEEANLILDNFSELEDALIDQEVGSLLQQLDGGTSLEDLLKLEEEAVDPISPASDAVKAVINEAWRADRVAWWCEEQQWLDEVGSLSSNGMSFTIFRPL